MVHMRVSAPLSGGTCDGAKYTARLSFALSFSVAMNWAVLMELLPVLQ